MEVLISELAKIEIDDAVHFYELEYEGLGSLFKCSKKK